MKMARIANLDYATATDYMTAALRGFNMELNEAKLLRLLIALIWSLKQRPHFYHRLLKPLAKHRKLQVLQ